MDRVVLSYRSTTPIASVSELNFSRWTLFVGFALELDAFNCWKSARRGFLLNCHAFSDTFTELYCRKIGRNRRVFPVEKASV